MTQHRKGKPMTNKEPHWRKSSRSLSNGACVELAHLGAVRDSKNPDGPTLLADINTLITAVKTDQLGQ